jgi:regulator of sirC expression with transglutaminase-like and TPR domain
MVAPARKAYTNDEKIDALVRMNTELLSELWIMRDRMMVLEHLLEKKTGLSRQEIDEFDPPPAFETELLAERDALVRRVVGAPWNDHWTVESIVKNKGR